jgi:predicted TIM-barrel fold metal-dependent hydrolase
MNDAIAAYPTRLVGLAPVPLDNLIRQFGVNHIVLGSDYPAGMGNFMPAAAQAELTALSQAEMEAVRHGNDTQIFDLCGA